LKTIRVKDIRKLFVLFFQELKEDISLFSFMDYLILVPSKAILLAISKVFLV